MNEKTQFLRWTWIGWLLLILATAVLLRTIALADIPPGLTHDEADHGLTAWQIVNGERSIYFTVGYGREPLYDYATALLMAFTGPTYLAGRVTAVLFSLLSLAAVTAWVRRAFDAATALLTAAGMAVGFWAVMAGRQSLRSMTLPALFALALLVYWIGVQRVSPAHRRMALFALAGALLGLTFYTYIPARGMWLLLPLIAGYVTWARHPQRGAIWRGTAVSLLVALLVGLPLIVYLAQHPEAELRIRELSGPLAAGLQGDFSMLWTHAVGALQIVTFRGDPTWRYNVPGRPLLNPLLGVFFYPGLLIAGWRAVRDKKQMQGVAAFAALAWLGLGFAPVLITGPELSTTQAMGMQPVLYLFPALALREMGAWAAARWPRLQRRLWAAPLIIFGVTAVLTTRAYFDEWAQAPEVRVQYESTMMAAMDYLNTHSADAAAVSTITPGPFHTPALAQVTLRPDAVTPRWFDGRGSLLLPAAADSVLIFPGFAPLHPALQPYLETAVLETTLPLRETDLDRPLWVYRVDGSAARQQVLARMQTETAAAPLPVQFDPAVTLLGYELLTPAPTAGEEVQVATLWAAAQPLPVEARIFVHLLGPDGIPFAQQDRLDVPAEGWQAGDLFIQLHEFTIPETAVPGTYALVVGVYECAAGCENGRRLPIQQNEVASEDALLLQMVTIR